MNARPLLPALAALAAGIVLAPHAPPASLLLTAMAIGGATAVALRRRPRPCAAAILVTLLLAGMLLAQQAAEPLPDDVSRYAGKPSLWVRGSIASAVDERPGRRDFTLAVDTVHDYLATRTASGQLRVSVRLPRNGGAPPPPLAYGEAVWLRGRIEAPPAATNPGAFDYRAYLARRGIHATLATKRSVDVRPTGREAGTPAGSLASGLREAVRHASARHLSATDAALFDGLLLSIRGRIPADLEDAFSRTGTVHVLSTSGLHLGVLALCLAWLAARLTLPRRAAFPAILVVVWLYALAAGSGPAVLRSAGMISVFLLAPLLRRSPDPLNSLLVAVFGLLLVQPLCLYDAGTQFTVATVATLILWMRVVEPLFYPWEPGLPARRRFGRFVAGAFAVGLVAQAGSWPLAAWHFNILSPIAPLANVAIAPLASGLLIGGLIAVILSPLPLLGGLAFLPIAAGLHLLRLLVAFLADLPFAAVSTASPPALAIVLYYLLLWSAAPLCYERFCRPRLFAPEPLPAE